MISQSEIYHNQHQVRSEARLHCSCRTHIVSIELNQNRMHWFLQKPLYFVVRRLGSCAIGGNRQNENEPRQLARCRTRSNVPQVRCLCDIRSCWNAKATKVPLPMLCCSSVTDAPFCAADSSNGLSTGYQDTRLVDR